MYHKKNIFYPWVEKGEKARLLTTDHSQGVRSGHLSLGKNDGSASVR